MEHLKELSKYVDLYPVEVILSELTKRFEYVSHTANCKTIPTCGSICRKSETVRPADDLKIKKLIFHRSGRVTIQTDKNYFFQFLNL
jgi:hypothetical protein